MESKIIKKTEFNQSGKISEWIVLGICLICMFLFLYTAYGKLLEHDRFSEGLSKVAIISSFAVYISWLVPAAEILISVLLIIPNTYKWGLYGFSGLMILFTGYMLSMVLWAKKLPCRCGGAIESLSWPQHILFNVAYIVIAVFGLWISQSKSNLKNH